jgi:hypothetical protein
LTAGFLSFIHCPSIASFLFSIAVRSFSGNKRGELAQPDAQISCQLGGKQNNRQFKNQYRSPPFSPRPYSLAEVSKKCKKSLYAAGRVKTDAAPLQ